MQLHLWLPEAFGTRNATSQLTGDYWLFSSSPYQTNVIPRKVTSKALPIIEANVVQVAWDGRFIIAKRQHLKAREEFPGDDVEVPDPGKYDYWILDTEGPKLHGPFDEEQFGTERQALGVPTKLRLNDVSDVYARHAASP